MKGKKRLIALLLSFLMVLSQMSVATFALDNVADDSEQAAAEQAVEETQPAADENAVAVETEPEVAEQAAAEAEKAVTELEKAATEPAKAEEKKAEPAKDEEKKAEPDKAEAKEEAFDQSQTVDGVTVNVSAAKGVFPAGSKLSVSKVAVPGAVDTSDAEAAYAFDISILSDGKKIQPDGKATVSFTTEEVADYDTAVYHMDGGAQKMSVSESGETASVRTTGFSVYVVTFSTYTVKTDQSETKVGDTEVTLKGDETKGVAAILKGCGVGDAGIEAITGVSIESTTGAASLVDDTSDSTGKAVKANSAGDAVLNITRDTGWYGLKVYVTVTVSKYEVTFDLNGASGTAPATQEVVPNGYASEPGDPSWDNHMFGYWVIENGTTPFDFETTPITEDTKLVAHWHHWTFNGYPKPKEYHKHIKDSVIVKCDTVGCYYYDGTTLSLSMVKPGDEDTIIYDGESHEVKLNEDYDKDLITGVSDIKYYVKGDDGNYTVLEGKPTDAGDYYATSSITHLLGNQLQTERAIKKDFTIQKAYPEVTPPTKKTLTYNGQAQELVEEGKTTGGTLQYALGKDADNPPEDESSWGTTVPKGTDAGSYYVWYRVKGDKNYYDTEKAECVIAEINKADPEVTKPVAKTMTYNGQAQELVTAGTTKAGVMVYALGKDAKTVPGETANWTTSVPKGTEVGTYYVWRVIVDLDENYNEVEPLCVTSQIVPRQFTITYDLNGGKLNGQTGKVTVTVDEGTVITLPAPTKSGYKFDYWEGSKYNAGDKYTVTGDHTFKAVWKANSKGANTGDSNDITGLLALMIASVGALGALGYRRRKEDQ